MRLRSWSRTPAAGSSCRSASDPVPLLRMRHPDLPCTVSAAGSGTCPTAGNQRCRCERSPSRPVAIASFVQLNATSRPGATTPTPPSGGRPALGETSTGSVPSWLVIHARAPSGRAPVHAGQPKRSGRIEDGTTSTESWAGAGTRESPRTSTGAGALDLLLMCCRFRPASAERGSLPGTAILVFFGQVRCVS